MEKVINQADNAQFNNNTAPVVPSENSDKAAVVFFLSENLANTHLSHAQLLQEHSQKAAEYKAKNKSTKKKSLKKGANKKDIRKLANSRNVYSSTPQSSSSNGAADDSGASIEGKQSANSFMGALSSITSGDTPGLTKDEVAKLQAELSDLTQIIAMLQSGGAGATGIAIALQSAGFNNAHDLLASIQELVNKSGDSTMTSLMGQLQSTCPLIYSLLNGNDSSDRQTAVMQLAEAAAGLMKDPAFLSQLLLSTHTLSAVTTELSKYKPVTPPAPTPTPPAPTPQSEKGPKYGQMLSLRELFFLIGQLMDSQQSNQAADASLGQLLSEKESHVVSVMASKLNDFYSKNIAPLTKTSDANKIQENTAKLNLYKSEWDNFKSQIDANVQNQTNAAGTVDVNDVQQSSDFEQDVLQTWANVANQVAQV